MRTAAGLHLRDQALTMELVRLRKRLDHLSACVSERYGAESAPATRVEEVCAAMQRLEWAIERERGPVVLHHAAGA